MVVTDGFTGNVALKTAEGLARYFRTDAARGARPQSLLGPARRADRLRRRCGAWRQQFDPSPINGGPFLGLNGIVVKSHGGADARGFATAIRLAADLAASDFVARDRPNLRTMTAACRGRAAEARGENAWRELQSCAASSPAWAATCRRASSPTTISPRSSTPTTPGSVERTGIRQRREAVDGEATSDLAVEAAAKALAAAGRTPADVDLIIVATTTPDLTFPGRRRHRAAQARRCPVGIAFDVQAVCSGFVYALAVADNFVARGLVQVRAGHRRRDDDPADGLDRPRHLRAVRRRRRRGGAGAAARAGDHRRPRPAGRSRCAPTGPSRTCSTSTAAPRPPARSASCACRATRCSATRWSTSPRR